MGLTSFAQFQQLLQSNHDPAVMGFGSNASAGDINRLSSRFRLAKNFRGIKLEGYAPETVSGYDAFFQVFLTHSVLERFLEINSVSLNQLDELLRVNYSPEKVIQEFVEKDREGLFFKFLYKRLNNNLKAKLQECREYRSVNVGYISASIRHIFAHGYLCAHSEGMNPQNANVICNSVSSFVLDFIDAEFTRKITDYCHARGLFKDSAEEVKATP